MTQHIPKGTSKEDVYLRRAIIVERLYPMLGKSVPCRAFGARKVEFLYDSIDETATRASRRYESTLAALRVVEALRDAKMVRSDTPRAEKQKRMRFIKVYELRANLKGIGNVKIIVGELRTKRVLHYSITAQ